MARRVFTNFAVVLFTVVMMMEGWRSEAAMACGQIVMALTPCIEYSRGGATLPPACCDGLLHVIAESKANPDLQAACQCIKNLAETVPGIREDLVNTIPGKCGVNLPWKLSLSLDCSKVHW